METTPGEEALVGTVLDGRYRIVEIVGTGGMGTVYRAKQTSSVLERDVAIKLLNTAALTDPAQILRFETEARIIAELRHPNTLKLLDTGRLEDERLYLVTEFLYGSSLESVMVRGILSVARALHIACAVCESVIEAHSHDIVHRDLKPSNIFLEELGEQEVVKVLDFGLAKMINVPGVTAPMALCGTPGYMAPEQIRGMPVDQRADIYALGAIFYECLSGKQLFRAKSMGEMLSHHASDEPPTPLNQHATVDAELERIIMRMVEKAPERRPQTMAYVLRQLGRVDHRLNLDGQQVFDLVTDTHTQPVTVPGSKKLEAMNRLSDKSIERAYADTIPPVALAKREANEEKRSNPRDLQVRADLRAHMDAFAEESVTRPGDIDDSDDDLPTSAGEKSLLSFVAIPEVDDEGPDIASELRTEMFPSQDREPTSEPPQVADTSDATETDSSVAAVRSPPRIDTLGTDPSKEALEEEADVAGAYSELGESSSEERDTDLGQAGLREDSLDVHIDVCLDETIGEEEEEAPVPPLVVEEVEEPKPITEVGANDRVPRIPIYWVIGLVAFVLAGLLLVLVGR